MFDNRKVGATAIHEHRRLALCTRERFEWVAGWIKDQRSSSARTYGLILNLAVRQPKDEAAVAWWNIGLNSRKFSGGKVLLRVSVIAVKRLGCEPPVDVIPIR